MSRSLLAAATAASAVAFMGFVDRNEWYSAPAKIVPIIFLILMVVGARGSNGLYSWRVALGLCFSLIGDVLLEIENGRPMFFNGGLAAFLLGHIMYIRAFYLDPQSLNRWVVLLLSIFCCFIFSTLYPHLAPELVAPVFFYALTITLMALFALSRQSSDNSWKLGAIGALTFVCSDTVLAMNRFVGPVSYADTIIMMTYYLGQFNIALSSVSRPMMKQE